MGRVYTRKSALVTLEYLSIELFCTEARFKYSLSDYFKVYLSFLYSILQQGAFSHHNWLVFFSLFTCLTCALPPPSPPSVFHPFLARSPK